MSSNKLRVVSGAAFLAAVVLFCMDGLFIHYDQFLDGIGIKSTFILPPIGLLAVYFAQKRGHTKTDTTLIIFNILALLLFPLYMFFGTLILGP
ncbi:hypothetical protein [Paenibacillus sp. FSL R7-0652]|uniref:Uncharacterized protein n=1 Tax=Paenibacillus sp. AN1007 TaxID=3151385 RepID=A0AAU8NDP3_9BACL